MKLYGLLLFAIFFLSCEASRKVIRHSDPITSVDVFWYGLQNLCGQSFSGILTNSSITDTIFRDKALIIHVRSCGPDIIRIPFIVGDDRSRTWVLTRTGDRITLKHDHRHEDGSRDNITQYGGSTTHSGNDTLQVFPADQFTVDMLPAAVGNAWWIEFVNGVHFTYNLRRVQTERRFSVRFDLTKPVKTPDAPWGWKD